MLNNPTCMWVLASGKPCDEKTNYRMVPNGGEPGAPLIRDYNPFCGPHTAASMRPDPEDN